MRFISAKNQQDRKISSIKQLVKLNQTKKIVKKQFRERSKDKTNENEERNEEDKNSDDEVEICLSNSSNSVSNSEGGEYFNL